MENNKFGETLRRIRKERGWNQQELADVLGTTKQVISRYERGERSPKVSVADEYARILGVKISDLAGEEKPLPDIPGIIPIRTRRIPLLGDIACGTPCEPTEEFELYVSAGTDVRADYALRAHGDSMIGARIHDGDIVFIRSQPTVDDGEIAAVLIDGETTLKRIRHVSGQLLLCPDNQAYSPIIANAGQDVRILGKAIAFQSDVR